MCDVFVSYEQWLNAFLVIIKMDIEQLFLERNI